jgi:hypothetical protein
MVERSSALLYMEREVTRKQVDGDHKEIVRIRQGQGGVYPSVLRIIKNALQSASEQFAALRLAKETQSETTATDQNDVQTEDENQNSEEYDVENFLCDACDDEFLKRATHYHCYICEDGFFNICRSCKKSGMSCPGGHDMLKRRLGDPKSFDDESDDEDGENEDEEDENFLVCNSCNEDFRKDEVHYHCVICGDGDYDLCRGCRKSGRICPGRHKMLKRKLPINTPTIANDNAEESPLPAVSSKDPPPPKENSSPTQYCDNPNCNCELPKRVETPSPPKENSSPTQYCDNPNCNCELPKRVETPSPSKENSSPTQYCDVPHCDCGLPKRVKNETH